MPIAAAESIKELNCCKMRNTLVRGFGSDRLQFGHGIPGAACAWSRYRAVVPRPIVVSFAEPIGVVTTFALRNRSEEAPPSKILTSFTRKKDIHTTSAHRA